MKYHLVQLGCAMNHADGERIASVLNSMGYEPTDNEHEAILLGVVACSVRQKAIDKVYSRISKWNEWKLTKPLLTFVSGCILPSDREKFLERFDLIFSIADLATLPDLISQYGVPGPYSITRASTDASRPAGPLWLKDVAGPVLVPGSLPSHIQGERQLHERQVRVDASKEALRSLQEVFALRQQSKPSNNQTKRTLQPLPLAGEAERPSLVSNQEQKTMDPLGGFWQIQPHYHSSFEAHIPIQNGCDKFCTFCAVPYTRGREVSRSADSILAEVRRLLDQGYKSITLLGQNVNSYGLDAPDREPGFASLLDRIGRLGSDEGYDFWLYFTSPHPRDMSREVIETMARHRVIAKQVHLPLQSGDDKVLIRMNRKHSLEDYRRIVGDIRELMPEATLFTDIIVGFTGETDEQFDQTRKAMEEFSYTMAFIAMYSPRPGAASGRWDDDVPLPLKKQRLAELSEVLHQSAGAYNRAQIGKNLRVLVQGRDKKDGHLAALTEGRVNVRVAVPEASNLDAYIGTFRTIEVISAKDMSLEGVLVD